MYNSLSRIENSILVCGKDGMIPSLSFIFTCFGCVQTGPYGIPEILQGQTIELKGKAKQAKEIYFSHISTHEGILHYPTQNNSCCHYWKI